MKTLEQLIVLSKNPHYVFSKEELRLLEEYRRTEEEVKQNKNIVKKHDTSFDKHDVTIGTIKE